MYIDLKNRYEVFENSNDVMTKAQTLKALRLAKRNLQDLINYISIGSKGLNLDEFQCELANLVENYEFENELHIHFNQLD